MHLKKMLICTFGVVFTISKGQTDTTFIKLDEVKVKAFNPLKSIYQDNKVDELTQQINIGKDLAHQLESLSGVQIRKNGSNVSKPIIDGLSSSRLVYMVNGVKLENQDWADAHSPEIDADLADNLSIMRGAETVKFGSNALGGVINANGGNISNNHHINGSFSAHYIGNTGGVGGRLKAQQNVKNIKGLKWRLSLNKTKNGDYSTAEYNVSNSGTTLWSYMLELNYKLKNLELYTFYSKFKSDQGNYFGSLTGNIEEFEERINLGRPLQVFPYSFDIEAPYQKSNHNIYNVEAKWKFNDNWYTKSQYTFQNNHREEFDVRRNLTNSVPVQNMILSSHHINTELGYKNSAMNSVVGFQLRNKENYNQPGTATITSLPNYIYKENAIYTYHTYKLNQWILNAGLRYDWALFNARGINFLGHEYGKNKKYDSFSAQLASQYNYNQWEVNSSLSYGWRVPEAFELYANGKQHGIPIYFVGNHDLNPEKGFKWVNKIAYKTDNFTTELQGVVNYLKDYIYAIPSHEYKQLFTGPAAIFQFKQQDALIVGIDFIQNTNLTSNLNIINKLSWIQGEEIDTKNSLPNISPIRLHNHIRYNLPRIEKFEHNSFQLSHDFVAKKNKFNPTYELSEQVPNSYHLFNIALSTNLYLSNSMNIITTFSIDNLFNQLYKDYLNLHRYFVHDRGRSINVNVQLNF